jgi:hypothetical protein
VPGGSHKKEKGFVVTLRPLPNVDAVKALRWVLKSALRKHGLRCTDVRVEHSPIKGGELNSEVHSFFPLKET